MADRQCVYCGKTVSDRFLQCPYCRENLDDARSGRHSPKRRLNAARYIRRGLLYMLLSAVCYYLFGGYHPILTPPFSVEPWLTDYAIPGLFLAGLVLMLLGLVRRYAG